MKKFIYVLLIAVTLSFMTGCGKESDAVKFKKEYESYNGKTIENSKYKYPEVEISSKNKVKYADADKMLEVLDKGTGILYFGYPTCPWCRNAVPVLIEAANELGIEDIYYMNVKDERDEMKVREDGTLETTKEGTKGYYQLLKRMDAILDEYTLEDINGNSVSTNEKRIFVPLVVFVREGEIVGYHLDTVPSQENPFKLLDENQKNELMDIYVDLIHKVLNDVCDSTC